MFRMFQKFNMTTAEHDKGQTPLSMDPVGCVGCTHLELICDQEDLEQAWPGRKVTLPLNGRHYTDFPEPHPRGSCVPEASEDRKRPR
jgi:hypothetical protein